jgi:O-antigen ligase
VATSAKIKQGKLAPVPIRAGDTLSHTIFAGMFGALLGLSLLKFGNPILMEKMVDQPGSGWEWAMDAWPVVIGYWMLAAVAVLGLFVAKWKVAAPKILIMLPLVWFLWEVVAGTQSEYKQLSGPTVGHFLTCVVCFYLGLFSLNHVDRLWAFWMGLLVGFFLVLAFGFEQHFGGLEGTRQNWLLYIYPTLKEIQPGFYKKMMSNRIFSTLMYPNTLAGVILMLLPITLAIIWSCQRRFTVGARGLLMSIAALAGFACLYWSGSKSGWLLMMLLGVVASMYLPIAPRTKVIILAGVLVLGLAGFVVKNMGYIKKGAPSAEARLDYWSAALKTTARKPVFGTGPGTFAQAYQRVKKPESEMARLTHNDYLEQASDSGLPGFVAYAALVFGIMGYVWRKGALEKDWVKLAVWLGVLGWALQSFSEFGLYIPAIGWPAFAFLGWLLGRSGNPFDSTPRTS